MTNPLLDPEFIYDYICDINAQRQREILLQDEVERLSNRISTLNLN